MSSAAPMLRWLLQHRPPSFTQTSLLLWKLLVQLLVWGSGCKQVGAVPPGAVAPLATLTRDAMAVHLQYLQYFGHTNTPASANCSWTCSGEVLDQLLDAEGLLLTAVQGVASCSAQCTLGGEALRRTQELLTSPVLPGVHLRQLAAYSQYYHGELRKFQQQQIGGGGQAGSASSSSDFDEVTSLSKLQLPPDHEAIAGAAAGGRRVVVTELRRFSEQLRRAEDQLGSRCIADIFSAGPTSVLMGGLFTSVANLCRCLEEQCPMDISSPRRHSPSSAAAAVASVDGLKVILEAVALMGAVGSLEGVYRGYKLLNHAAFAATPKAVKGFLTSRGNLLLRVLWLVRRWLKQDHAKP